jgi:hypothetical protein
MLGYTELQQQRKIVARHFTMMSEVPRVVGEAVHHWPARASVPFTMASGD